MTVVVLRAVISKSAGDRQTAGKGVRRCVSAVPLAPSPGEGRGARRPAHAKAYLPGTGDTVIHKAVPHDGGPTLHFVGTEVIDCPKCGQLGCVIFVSGGLRSRYPLKILNYGLQD